MCRMFCLIIVFDLKKKKSQKRKKCLVPFTLAKIENLVRHFSSGLNSHRINLPHLYGLLLNFFSVKISSVIRLIVYKAL